MDEGNFNVLEGGRSTTYSPDALAKRPTLAAWVGRIIAEWAEVELQLAQLMCEAMEASAAPFAVAFEALGSSSAQINVAQKTIRSRLDGDAEDAFLALMTMFREAKKARDAVAHATWGWSDQVPDALFAVDPKYRVRNAAAMMPHWKPTAHGRIAVSETATFSRESVTIYDQAKLSEIGQRPAQLASC